MTEFEHAKIYKCHICHEPFCDVEGKVCDCDKEVEDE